MDGDQSDRGAALVHGINLLVLGCLFVGAMVIYPDLPDRIPVHFDGVGAPDRLVDKGLGQILALPLVALGMAAFFYLLAAATRPRHVKALDGSDLDPALRLRALALLRGTLFWSAVGTSLLFGVLLVGMVQVAQGRAGSLGMGPWMAPVVAGAIPVVGVIRYVRVLKPAQRTPGS